MPANASPKRQKEQNHLESFARDHKKDEREHAQHPPSPTMEFTPLRAIMLDLGLDVPFQLLSSTHHPDHHRRHRDRGGRVERKFNTVVVDERDRAERDAADRAGRDRRPDTRHCRMPKLRLATLAQCDEHRHDNQRCLDCFAERDHELIEELFEHLRSAKCL